MSALIADRLQRRVRAAGADPLITYYEPAHGVRTELSAVTFANWVDKTCHLVTDEFELDEGDVVELAVATTHPGHWVSACWQLTCWRLGLVVSVGSGLTPNLVVAGPDWSAHVGGEVAVVACSLHPLGLGLPTLPPLGVADYALEVRGQPDGFAAGPQSGSALGWADAERRLSQADLIALDGAPDRRLLRPSDPWSTARDGILTAVVTGGSYVCVVGGEADILAKIAADERALTETVP